MMESPSILNPSIRGSSMQPLHRGRQSINPSIHQSRGHQSSRSEAVNPSIRQSVNPSIRQSVNPGAPQAQFLGGNPQNDIFTIVFGFSRGAPTGIDGDTPSILNPSIQGSSIQPLRGRQSINPSIRQSRGHQSSRSDRQTVLIWDTNPHTPRLYFKSAPPLHLPRHNDLLGKRGRASEI